MKVDSLHILISQLKMKGAMFITDGESLRVKAPTGVIESGLRKYLQSRKAAIIDSLSKETIIREWVAKVASELSFPLDLPPEFSNELEDKIVDFIDGQIAFDELETMWSHFVERYKAERTYEEETL